MTRQQINLVVDSLCSGHGVLDRRPQADHLYTTLIFVVYNYIHLQAMTRAGMFRKSP